MFQEPDIIGCNQITHYSIWYRLKVTAGDEWTKSDTISNSSTTYTLTDLESGSYEVRVAVDNDDEGSQFAELSYLQGMSGKMQLYYHGQLDNFLAL